MQLYLTILHVLISVADPTTNVAITERELTYLLPQLPVWLEYAVIPYLAPKHPDHDPLA